MIAWALLVLGAYLLGSVSFSVLVVQGVAGVDPRERGSGNAGATNTLRVAGVWAAFAVLLLDVGKGLLPVMLAWTWGAPAVVAAAAAAATVVGHVYPLFFGLRGGKGVATAAGALGALVPLAFVGSFAVFVIVVATTRYVSLGSVLAVVSFPIWMAGLAAAGVAIPGGAPFLAACAAVPALIVWRHRGNLARLRAGTERRLGARRGARR